MFAGLRNLAFGVLLIGQLARTPVSDITLPFIRSNRSEFILDQSALRHQQHDAGVRLKRSGANPMGLAQHNGVTLSASSANTFTQQETVGK
ncbi:MAG: hypothetical protein ACI97A_002892 [Planctomycetota bacterium]